MSQDNKIKDNLKLMLINEAIELQNQINKLRKTIYKKQREERAETRSATKYSINNYEDYFNTPNQGSTGKMYMLNHKIVLDTNKKHRKQPKVLIHKVINPISRKRKENNNKKLLYKTPLPKTIRIHYKTPRQNRTKIQKKKTIKRIKQPSESNKHLVYEGNRNGFNHFFRNLSK